MHMVFIATVVYNRREALLETICSVRALKNQGVHYLVIDGGSTDGTVEAIKDHADTIDSWLSEPDAGIYDAMNKAVDRIPQIPAYVLFLGAGDRLISLPSPTDLSSGADVLFGDVVIGNRRFVSTVGWRLRIGNTLHHQGLFVSRSALGDRPFDTGFRIYADFDLNQRLFNQQLRFHKVDQIIAIAAPDGISWRADQQEVFDICERNFGWHYALLARAWALYHAVKCQLGLSPY